MTLKMIVIEVINLVMHETINDSSYKHNIQQKPYAN